MVPGVDDVTEVRWSRESFFFFLVFVPVGIGVKTFVRQFRSFGSFVRRRRWPYPTEVLEKWASAVLKHQSPANTGESSLLISI